MKTTTTILAALLFAATADVTCTAGNTLTIQINAAGVLALSGAES